VRGTFFSGQERTDVSVNVDVVVDDVCCFDFASLIELELFVGNFK
jgi:hypothetical protein